MNKFLPLLATMTLGAATSLLAATPPNILVILTDDQGYADYSAIGTKDISTPNIDRLFHEGATITNFHANSSVCSPSRAALLSGCYPDRVGVPGVIRETPDSFGYLTPTVPLLPSVLHQYGYATALIGKWHLGIETEDLPNARGFDLFEGFLEDMLDDDYTHLRGGVDYMRINTTVVNPTGHITDVLTNWAISYLQSAATQSTPFFLELAYTAPHTPIEPPPLWLAAVQKAYPQSSPTRQKYVALVEHLDSDIGQVLNTLDTLGLTDNTLIIFASDNGGLLISGANDGPLHGQKGDMYEGGLRVPAAARWPGHIAAGSSVSRIIQTMDIFPTACDAAGATAGEPAGIDAKSFLPDLLGGTPTAVNPNFYFIVRVNAQQVRNALIDGTATYKLVLQSPPSAPTLYDIATDPNETTDISGQQPVIYSTLQSTMNAHIAIGAAVPWVSPF